MAKIKNLFKSKKNWKSILLIGLSCIMLVGAIVGICSLFREKEETTTQIVNPTYAVGGLTEDGRFLETDKSIYTEDTFGCLGLDVELAFKNDISYRIFFYDVDGDFVSSTDKQIADFNGELPWNASQCRIVITPNEDDKISWYEKSGYAKQLTISVDVEQKWGNINYFAIDDTMSNLIFNKQGSTVGSAPSLVESSNGVYGCSSYVDVDGWECLEIRSLNGVFNGDYHFIDADGNYVTSASQSADYVTEDGIAVQKIGVPPTATQFSMTIKNGNLYEIYRVA